MFNDDFNGGNGLLFIIILALLFGWGNGGFGGGNGQTNVLSADMQRGFDTQNIMSRFDTIAQNQTNAAYENAQLINGVNTSILKTSADSNMAMMNGFNGVQTQINNLSHQLSDCCCSLKTQLLTDRNADLQNQLNLAQIASANAVQTQNILGNLGRYYSNPPVNPYYVYNGYGYNGTTIS